MKYQRSALLASACAYALAMAAVAQAQQAPADKDAALSSTSLEEVVVTGSFIKGTPEDSAMPVEVMNYEELLDMGRPSNLDLVKNMSEGGGIAGENNRVNFYPIGAVTANLRSLGTRFTTVVFNGRRFPEQFSVSTGRFNNIAWIPNAALGSVETLKAGGGTTYGADAVAGVVNYVTRKNFEGLEINADYRHIEDSRGDYNADALWGKKFDNSNVMISVSYQHRSRLQEIDREWARYSYLENPASWQFATFPTSNPGAVMFLQGATAASTAYTPGTVPGSNIQMGSTGVVRDLGCAELGGFRGFTPTGSPSCYTNTGEMEDLVSEQNMYNVYLEHNLKVSDALKFHTELLLFRQDIPHIALSSTFVSNPAAWPLVGNAPQTVNAIYGSTNAFYVPGNNPAVGYLLNNLKNSNGSTVFSNAQITSITSGAGGVALLNTLWKPFGNGGSPLTGQFDEQEGHLKMLRITEAIGGDFPEFWGNRLEWEIGLTYGKINDVKQANDILVDRMQSALRGFGGTYCTGATAGANGCQFFNPFSSAIQSNVFTGASNPYFNYSLANDPGLIAWMYVPIEFERVYKNYVVDPIIRGDLGIDLPGGPIAVALGGQFRMQTEDTILDDYTNRNINPCATLGVTTCTTQQGALMYGRPANVFGAAASNFRPEFRRFPVYAGFAETKLPILSSLDVSLSGRYEKFISDVTDIDNSVFVPAVGIKWQPLDWVGARASWGKTFSQVNPPRATSPVAGTGLGSTKYTGLGATGNGFGTANYPNVDVQPEKGEYLDLGLLFNVENFRANVDYYSIKINDYTRTMGVANVLDAVAMPFSGTSIAADDALINCASAALTQPIAAMGGKPLVELAIPGGNAACQQGVTKMADIGAVGTATAKTPIVHPAGTVNYFAATNQTNSGTLKTSGVDLSMSYRFDNVFGGSLTPSVDVSRILKWELGDFLIAGVKVADGYDGLGYVNLSSGRTGVSVAKYRGTFGVAYRYEGHTLNIQAQYVPSIINEDTTQFAPSTNKNPNIGDANGFTSINGVCVSTAATTANLGNVPAGAGTGQFASSLTGTPASGLCAGQNTSTLSGQSVDAWLNIDLVYRFEVAENTNMTLTINNLFDREPSFFRGIVPYNTAYGSPLGRTVKLGINQKF